MYIISSWLDWFKLEHKKGRSDEDLTNVMEGGWQKWSEYRFILTWDYEIDDNYRGECRRVGEEMIVDCSLL